MATLDKAGLLARLARALAAEAGDAVQVRMCRAFARIFEADGAAITLAYDQPERMVLCSTDETAAQIEDLQEVLGEGPGQQAYDSGRMVSIDLRPESSTWTTFTSAARAAVGELVIYAVPIKPSDAVIGVLTVHQQSPITPNPDAAQFVAAAIGTALQQDPTAFLDDLNSRAWGERAVIHQATGMVVVQLGITTADAVALLRAHAFAHATSLSEVAQRVVSRELRFADPDTSTRPGNDPGEQPPHEQDRGDESR